jgi:hypothetical protein
VLRLAVPWIRQLGNLAVNEIDPIWFVSHTCDGILFINARNTF